MNSKLLIAAIAASFVVSGCGGDDTLPDGGSPDGGNATVYALVPGTYVLSAATELSDGCNVNPNGGTPPWQGTEVALTNDNGLIGLGAIVGTPAQPAQGQGQVNNNTGTLVRDNQVTNGACTYNLKITNVMTVTANNTATMKYTRVVSNPGSGCVEVVACTSNWTHSITKKP